jgi:probable rRNA maturation factor
MIEVEVEDWAWTDALANVAALAREAALAASGEAETREIAINLTSDAAVADLNQRFRGRRGPTNVLSFPDARPQSRLGDIALAFGVTAAEAQAQGKPLADHLRHLVVHGVLHLLGYDHERDADADRMEAAEREILAGMNISDPYRPS